ncbi:MAG: LacI family transcriptional regulator [Propionibacteriales bacterium]|nr:LacI family transcriptional regulator [Propionibacteriales bacterium]
MNSTGPARLVDVARSASVSVATVSRVLNGHHVDAELSARVRAAVASLDYRPNAIARSLRRRDTQVWAVVITDVTNPFFTSLVRGIEDVAQESGYSVLLGNSDESAIKQEHYLQVAESERVAGVVLTPAESQASVSRLTAVGIPVVTVDRPLGEDQAHSVADSIMADSAGGAEVATAHLLSHGWSRPACIAGPQRTITAQDRARGYERAMLSSGLSPRTVWSTFTTPGGHEAAQALLGGDDRPDALVLGNSAIALGALAAVAAAGLVVGRDIGLVGFDDSPWAPLMTPPLTVVSQPAYELGADAARLLLARIQGTGPTDPVRILRQTTLIERGSCRRQ